jgi:membrane peptidoglycan carboxypeptidase
MTTMMTANPAGWRSSSFLLRFVWVGVCSVIAVGCVGLLAVWGALRIDWDVPPQPVLAGPSVVFAADGTELARFTTQVDRTEVPLSSVSPDVIAAIVASEDASFYEHTGVDPIALVRAVYVNIRTGSIEQGGSTLTQQYVKNAFVGDDITLQRKVEEAVLSISLERRLTKDQILEAYLNTVYFGEGADGVEAAALTYFGKSASALTVAQGATLAQLLPAPSVRNPVNDPQGALRRRDALLRRMGEIGVLTAPQTAAAIAEPLGVVARALDLGVEPFVVQHVKRILIETYGEELVLTGALQVTLTVQPDAMAAVEAAVQSQLPLQDDHPGIDAGAIAVDPRTGNVLAWYGGRTYADSQFDLAMQASRRPGSTFKPIAFVAALEQGIGPDTQYPAPNRFQKGELCDPGWGPANAGGTGYESMPLREGLYRSINTIFAQVGCDVGSDALADTAARLGIRSTLERTPQLAIGGFGANTTVADLAQVYATFANDGLQCPLRTILKVTDRSGRQLPTPVETTADGIPRAPDDAMLDARPGGWKADDGTRCHRMMDRDDARVLQGALEMVVAETTGRRADIGRPQAGKTGTTDEEVDAWFAGFTPDLAMIVRVGDTEEEPMRDIEGFAKVQGGTIPALIWRDAATVLLADVAARPFLKPGAMQVTIDPTQRTVVPTAAPTPTETPTATATEPTPPPPSPTPTPSPTPDEGILGPRDPGDPRDCDLLIFGCDGPGDAPTP